jgi:hypothetical protein
MKQFLDSKETYYKVLEILKRYVNIDKINNEDFIAGGSVSNILTSMVHGGQPVINDIDVYHRVEEEKKSNINGVKSIKDNWYPTTFITESGLQIVDDHYGRIFITETGSMMRVVNHSRNGLINNINYIYKKGNGDKNEKYVVIDGFDLNCCKAGLDLESEKIIYTPEFVDFLKTKQIRVINPCSPIQSSIRLFKKIKELNAYCDIKHEMRFLTAAAKNLNNRTINKIIGPETKIKYDKFKNEIEKYFILRPLKPSDLQYHNDVEIKENLWSYDPVLNFDIFESVDNMSKLKKIWDLMYNYRNKSEQNKINKIFYKNVFLDKKSVEDVWERVVRNDDDKNKSEIKPTYNSYRFTFEMLMSKKDYYKCNFNVKHVDYVDEFCHEHGRLRNFLKHTNTLEETYQIIKFIKNLTNKEGQWFIGSLETLNWSEYKDLIGNTITNDVILEIFKKEKETNTKELVDKIDLKDFKWAKNVKELTTVIDLKSEGQMMGHCVGGYGKKVKNGYSRIFHIQTENSGSTLEVYLPITKKINKENTTINIKEVYEPTSFEEKCIVIYEDNTLDKIYKESLIFRKAQHSGNYPTKGNQKPIDENDKIAEELINFLNKNHLPNNYKIKI